MIRYIALLFIVLGSWQVHAQISIGTSNRNPSAQLHLESTDRGMLIPQVSLTGTTDATTISEGNKEGLLVFNNNAVSDIVPGYYFWDGTKWNPLISESIVKNKETTTTLTDNQDGSYTYTSENGTQTTFSQPAPNTEPFVRKIQPPIESAAGFVSFSNISPDGKNTYVRDEPLASKNGWVKLNVPDLNFTVESIESSITFTCQGVVYSDGSLTEPASFTIGIFIDGLLKASRIFEIRVGGGLPLRTFSIESGASNLNPGMHTLEIYALIRSNADGTDLVFGGSEVSNFNDFMNKIALTSQVFDPVTP